MARKLDAAAIEGKRANRRDNNPRDRERIKQEVQNAAEANRLAPRTYEVEPPPPARNSAALSSQKPRVAYYCRVSTYEEEQAGSLVRGRNCRLHKLFKTSPKGNHRLCAKGCWPDLVFKHTPV